MCTSKYSLQMLRSQRWLPFFFIEVQSLERNYDSQLHVFTRGKLLWHQTKKGANTYRRPSKVNLFFLFLKKNKLYITPLNKQMTLTKKRQFFVCCKYVYSRSSSSPLFCLSKKKKKKKKTRLSSSTWLHSNHSKIVRPNTQIKKKSIV